MIAFARHGSREYSILSEQKNGSISWHIWVSKKRLDDYMAFYYVVLSPVWRKYYLA